MYYQRYLIELLVLVTSLTDLTSSSPRCKFFDDPKNGYVTCDSLFHLFCSPECHPGYRFATRPAVVYMCGPVTGEWFTYPVGSSVPWPDCIPDNSNEFDSIKHELTQKREAITKHITDTHKGIPTTPYTDAVDPEDRFHHLFDYIEKAQRAYQYRDVIEKEAQALQKEHHNQTNSYQSHAVFQAKSSTIKPLSTLTIPTEKLHQEAVKAFPATAGPKSSTNETSYGASLTPKRVQISGAPNFSSGFKESGLANAPVMTLTADSTKKSFQANYRPLNQGEPSRAVGFSATKPAVYTTYSTIQNTPVTYTAHTSFSPSNLNGAYSYAYASHKPQNKAIYARTSEKGAQATVSPQLSSNVMSWTPAVTNVSQNHRNFLKMPTAVPGVVSQIPQITPNAKMVTDGIRNQLNYKSAGLQILNAVPGVFNANPQNTPNAGTSWKAAVTNGNRNQLNFQSTGYKGSSGAPTVVTPQNLGKPWKPAFLSAQGKEIVKTAFPNPNNVSSTARPQEVSKGNNWKPTVLTNVEGQQKLESHPKVNGITSASDVPQRINPMKSKNILQLLTSGADKDLSNLDLHAHLRPLREAQSTNLSQNNKTTTRMTNQSLIHNNKANSQVNSQGKQDTSTIVQFPTNDTMSHIQPIIMSGSSVLNSIASLLSKKSRPKDLHLIGLKSTSNSSGLISDVRGNVSSQVINIERKHHFQSWLTRKNKTVQPISNMVYLNKLQSAVKQINTQTTTKTLPENSKTDAKQQDRLFKDQLHNLKEVQRKTHKQFKNFPQAIQNPSQKGHVDKTPERRPRMSSSMKGPVKEHFFYFPVRKNTLLDIFKEKMQNR